MRPFTCTCLALAAVIATAGGSPVRAQFEVRNDTSREVWVAFVGYNKACPGTPFQRNGWWRLKPGEVRRVQTSKLENRFSYFYAETTDKTWVWTGGASGTLAALTDATMNDWCWDKAAPPNTPQYSLRQVDAGDSDTHQARLKPPPGVSGGTAPAQPGGRTEHTLPARGGSGAYGPAKAGVKPATPGVSDEVAELAGGSTTPITPDMTPQPAPAPVAGETNVGYDIDECSGALTVQNATGQWVAVPRQQWTSVDVAIDRAGYWRWRDGSTELKSRGGPAFRYRVKRVRVWHAAGGKVTWQCYDVTGGTAPPPPPIPTVEVRVRRHPSVPLTDAEADAILARMGTILQTNDGTGDTVTAVRFVRLGQVQELASDVPAVIQTQQQWNALLAADGGVKVVRDIRWCGGPGGSIIGCAPLGSARVNLAVVRYRPSATDPTLESILWAHEYGHNCDLDHRTDDTNAVMYPSIAAHRVRVNADESVAFAGGPKAASGALRTQAATGEVRAQVPEGPRAHAPKVYDKPKDVLDFVRQKYIDGVPYEVASLYTDPADTDKLLKALADAKPEDEEFLPEIVTTLCYIGNPKAVDPLIAFVKDAAKTSEFRFKARNAALIHLGDLAQKLKDEKESEKVVAFLREVAGVSKDAQAVAVARAQQAVTQAAGQKVVPPTADELTTELAVSAVQGLGLAGTAKGEQALTGLKANPPALVAPMKAVYDDALETSKAVRGQGIEKYKKQQHEHRPEHQLPAHRHR